VRRHVGGGADLSARLTGLRFEAASRRGKYLWLPLAGAGECLIAHLGMSGQLLVRPPTVADERHLRVRLRFAGEPMELRFVDQRTFGGLLLDRLVPAADAPGEHLPAVVAHIARDPLDPLFDDELFRTRLRRRASVIKRALLDQQLISGVGNIYADEALWRAKVHGERPADSLRPAVVRTLLREVRAVLRDALASGGTSFDALYVNVNGESGYFERSLNVYGRAGKPCPRCGRAIRRTSFMNRSSYSCPRCQRLPRAKTVPAG
jgi:formamidopyrimidine-DNA glycosylase